MKKGERDAVAMARLYGRTDVVEFLISQFEPCTHAAGGLYYCDVSNTLQDFIETFEGQSWDFTSLSTARIILG